MDIVESQKRSQMMAAVRQKNTQPEMVVRTVLHGSGLRYRLHNRSLPGTPDIVFPSRRVAIFVHGCFWHGHTACRLATTPKTRTNFWLAKIDANRQRDRRTVLKLLAMGWKVVEIWECETRSPETLRPRLLAELKEYGVESSGNRLARAAELGNVTNA